MAPTMEGYLLKRGQMTAKRRYFTLKGSNLTYYGAKEEDIPRGQLTLGPDSRIVEITGKRGKSIVLCVTLLERGIRGHQTPN